MASNKAEQIAVLHIPHSSRYVPAEERQAILLDDAGLNRELLRMTDAYTDELFPVTPVEAGRVVFPLSRLVCDVERFPSDENEPMAGRGMGVIYTRTSMGDVFRAQPDAVHRQTILDRWYWPHHSTLERLVSDVVTRSGFRNRYKALVELGFNPAGFLNEESPLIGDEEALAFVISKNLVRRHLTTSQRAMVAADLTTLKHGQRKSDTSNDVSQADAAKMTKTSLPTVQRAAKVKAASLELAAKVRAGDLTVSGALAQIEPDKRAAPATNGHSDPGTTTNRHDISEDRLASDQLDNRRRHDASTTPRVQSPLETNDNSDESEIAPPEVIAENILYAIARVNENARVFNKLLKVSVLDREAVARINTAIDGMIKKWRSIQSTLEKES
jgi:hypothetical protein